MDTDVGQLIRDARRRAGLSQCELAERAGTSHAAISRYERRRQAPTVPVLRRLVAACGEELAIAARPGAQPPDGAGARAPTGRRQRAGEVALDLHDLAPLEHALARTPEQRLDDVVRQAELVRAARRAD